MSPFGSLRTYIKVWEKPRRRRRFSSFTYIVQIRDPLVALFSKIFQKFVFFDARKGCRKNYVYILGFLCYNSCTMRRAGRPGQAFSQRIGIQKSNRMQARFLIFGGSGPKNREDGCLLVMP